MTTYQWISLAFLVLIFLQLYQISKQIEDFFDED